MRIELDVRASISRDKWKWSLYDQLRWSLYDHKFIRDTTTLDQLNNKNIVIYVYL